MITPKEVLDRYNGDIFQWVKERETGIDEYLLRAYAGRTVEITIKPPDKGIWPEAKIDAAYDLLIKRYRTCWDVIVEAPARDGGRTLRFTIPKDLTPIAKAIDDQGLDEFHAGKGR